MMKGKENAPTVALIDPLWIGHHPMYFNQFTASFLRCGARVIGLCPDPEAAMKNLLQTPESELPANAADRVHFERIKTGGRSFFNGRFEGDPIHTFSRWRRSADTLFDAETRCGLRANLVYFPYIDSFLRFLPLSFVPDVLMGRPWSGLYLRNHHHGESPSPMKHLRMLAKGDALMRSRNCLGIGVLDERFIPAMEAFTRGPVTAYPDVTEGGMPDEPFPLTEEIRRKAAGRRIIGIIGLERRKGFVTLLRVAELSRRAGLPYYFVCLGACHPGNFTLFERAVIDDVLRGIASGKIDNIHFDIRSGRIREEADYNHVFSSFDIAWAAYEGFQGSSGTLSKAALFEIPCIASAGECVGQRVEHYRIGLTIPEGNAGQALAAIPLLLESKDRDNRPLSPRFDQYREDHSVERLDRILAELLASL
jgi:hypothetical protein